MKKAAVIRSVVAFLLIVAVAVIGLLVTFKIADGNRSDYFGQRSIQATTAAAAIDEGDVMALQGTEADLDTPAYQRLREQLVRIKNTDTLVRFVYLMRPQDGKMIFLVDAEDPSSPDYSPPGQVYEEAKPSDFDAFEGKIGTETQIEYPIKDRWGTWISATAYIVDGNGKAIASLGTDVDGNRALASFNEIRRLGIVFDMVAVFLLSLVSVQWILWQYNRNKREVERHEVEESQRRLNEELVKADGMKSEFIQLASHELRGPVNAVNIAVETMERSAGEKLNEDEKALMEVAKNGAHRLVDLVDDLLDYTRVEAGDLALESEEVDLGELVSKTVKLFEPLAGEKGLKLGSRLPAGDLSAYLDPQALLRVLENLIGNAIKFTESGQVDIALSFDADMVQFAVTDTGRGIPDEFRKDIFNKFSKLESGEGRTRGSGLGLALCKGLVEAQGGRIWYESRLGRGTTFRFEVPRRQVTT